MIKAVNVKNMKFKLNSKISMVYKGFAMLDTDSNTIVSYDGIHPYVLDGKKWIQACIDNNTADTMPRVAYYI